MTSAAADHTSTRPAEAATTAAAAPLTADVRQALAERAARAANPPASRRAAPTRPAARPAVSAAATRARRVAAIKLARRNAVLRYARAQIGDPYRWGGAGPNRWDCSGLTMKAMRQAGIRLPHSAAGQGVRGRRVARRNARATDLVVWGNYHVGIYLGNNTVLHSPQPGARVRIQRIWGSPQFRRLPRLS